MSTGAHLSSVRDTTTSFRVFQASVRNYSLHEQVQREAKKHILVEWAPFRKNPQSKHLNSRGCTSSLFRRHKFSTYLRKYQGGWLPDHMAGICWVFQETAELSSKWQHRCALLPITCEFPRSTSSPAPGGVSVLILVLLIGASCLRLTTSRIRFSGLSLAAPILPSCFKWKLLLVFVC